MPPPRWNFKDWHELAGSPIESLSFQGGTATQRFKGPWNQRWAFARQILNTSWAYHQQQVDDPKHEFLGDLIPRTVTMAPFKGEQQGPSRWISGIDLLARYEHVVLTVTYSSPKPGDPYFDPTDPEQLISEIISPISEITQLSPDFFQWDDGAAISDEEAPGKIHHMLEYELTRHFIDTVPQNAYDFVDHINRTDLRTRHPSMGNRLFEVETVLYQGCSVSRTTDLETGAIKQNIGMRFKIKRNMNTGDTLVHGHNSFWRADTQKWTKLKVKEDMQSPVDYANFPLANLEEL